MSVEFQDDTWRRVVAHAIRICNTAIWIQTTIGEDQRPIWHKIKNRRLTVCGGQVVRTPTTVLRSRTLPPPEEEQCIVCQFRLCHLTEIPGGKPTKPEPPKPPAGGPPEGPYTPNPPAMRLQVPIAQAA